MMKVLAFADLHGYDKALVSLKNKVKKSKPDLILCAGDFTLFEREIIKIIKKIDSFGKPVFLIHGNHESASLVKSLCNKSKNIQFIHKKIVELGGFLFFGFGGGGFSSSEKEFDVFVKKNKKRLSSTPLVLITHAPPFNTKLDFLDYSKHHAGCKSFSNFIKKFDNVVLAVSGHLHETEGKKDVLNNAVLCNPGVFGRIFNL